MLQRESPPALSFPGTPATHAAAPSAASRVGWLFHPCTAWAVLGVSLLLTGVACLISYASVQQRLQERFVFRTEEVRSAISKRMAAYEQVLRGGVGLFAASNEVDRQEWRRYVDVLQISQNWPGMQGMGYSQRILASELQVHEERVRFEGYAEYAVRPTHAREEYHSIVFLEPWSGRNLRAIGFDMYSEPTRREAMQRASDRGVAAVSGVVTLVQETDHDVQRGFLMYLPVYRAGAVLDSPQSRRDALQGFVYSPFRVRDLMHGIQGVNNDDIRFELFDTDQTSRASLMYSSDKTLEKTPQPAPSPSSTNALQRDLTTPIGGRNWSIHFETRPSFNTGFEQSQPLFVAVAGLCVDALLFYIIATLSRVRLRAERTAQLRTHELQRSRSEFEAVTQSASSAIVTADHTGHIVYANPAATLLFSSQGQALQGRPMHSLCAPLAAGQRGAHRRQLAQARRSRAAVEVTGQRDDGQSFALELSLARWRIDGACFTTAIARDITQRKEVERAKADFLTLVSHEMRTPLTTIAGPLALLTEGSGGTLPGTARQLVAMASHNTARLVRLVEDILETSRMESGQLQLRLAPLELAVFVRHAMAMNAVLLAKGAHRANLQLPTPPLWVLADSDKLMQVLTNLVSNAVKFSPPLAPITMQLQCVDNAAYLSVSDHGCGIPPEFERQIFGKFARAKHANGTTTEGLGLGLAISKSLVEGMRGSIGFHSVVGEGTTFWVKLPLAPSWHIAQPAPPSAPSLSLLHKETA